ncbi:MAG: TIGR03619 family F420-dependent LLM class oxidoreductase [Acidimicrobiia bacterium]|nr:TIGR03619 family F420-dependent LLM class oxidoreductase [Acidimicrobiia bacterium]
MKFGLRYASAGAYGGPDLAVPLAQAAEAVGFESIWTVEHTVVPANYASRYPYSADGKMAGGQDDVAMPDALIWLAFVAAAAPSLKLGTGVVILPQHNPVILAKSVATLDHLSRGRVLLGIGVGWMAEEFATLGVPFEDRGRRSDEYVDVLRALWGPGPASFEGEMVRFADVWCEPRPPAGRVPILVGGHTKLAARRAGRLGDGFFPTRGAPWDLVAEARRTAEAAGRDPAELEITLSVPADVGELDLYAERGVSRVLLPVQSIDDTPAAPSVDEVHRWADLVAKWP